MDYRRWTMALLDDSGRLLFTLRDLYPEKNQETQLPVSKQRLWDVIEPVDAVKNCFDDAMQGNSSDVFAFWHAYLHIRLSCRSIGKDSNAIALAGARVVCIVRVIDPPFFDLSNRQAQICRYIAAGHHNKAIAKELNLSADTVRTHRGHIMAKLGQRSAETLYSWCYWHFEDDWGPSL